MEERETNDWLDRIELCAPDGSPLSFTETQEQRETATSGSSSGSGGVGTSLLLHSFQFRQEDEEDGDEDDQYHGEERERSRDHHHYSRKIEVNLLDTPGHHELAIVTQRALHLADGAVLVADPCAGVERLAHTALLLKAMQTQKVNHVLCVSKLDVVMQLYEPQTKSGGGGGGGGGLRSSTPPPPPPSSGAAVAGADPHHQPAAAPQDQQQQQDDSVYHLISRLLSGLNNQVASVEKLRADIREDFVTKANNSRTRAAAAPAVAGTTADGLGGRNPPPILFNASLLDVGKGNLIFSSAHLGFAFTLKDWARIYKRGKGAAGKESSNLHQQQFQTLSVDSLAERLWSHWYCPRTHQWYGGGGTTTTGGGHHQSPPSQQKTAEEVGGQGIVWVRAFTFFVWQPLCKIVAAVKSDSPKDHIARLEKRLQMEFHLTEEDWRGIMSTEQQPPTTTATSSDPPQHKEGGGEQKEEVKNGGEGEGKSGVGEANHDSSFESLEAGRLKVLRKILGTMFPPDRAVAECCEDHLPSPLRAQQYRNVSFAQPTSLNELDNCVKSGGVGISGGNAGGGPTAGGGDAAVAATAAAAAAVSPVVISCPLTLPGRMLVNQWKRERRRHDTRVLDKRRPDEEPYYGLMDICVCRIWSGEVTEDGFMQELNRVSSSTPAGGFRVLSHHGVGGASRDKGDQVVKNSIQIFDFAAAGTPEGTTSQHSHCPEKRFQAGDLVLLASRDSSGRINTNSETQNNLLQTPIGAKQELAMRCPFLLHRAETNLGWIQKVPQGMLGNVSALVLDLTSEWDLLDNSFVKYGVVCPSPSQLAPFTEAVKQVQKTFASRPYAIVSIEDTGNVELACPGNFALSIFTREIAAWFPTTHALYFHVSPASRTQHSSGDAGGGPSCRIRESISIPTKQVVTKSPNKHNRIFGSVSPLHPSLAMAVRETPEIFAYQLSGSSASSREGLSRLGQLAVRQNSPSASSASATSQLEQKRIWAFSPEARGANAYVDCTKGARESEILEVMDGILAGFHWSIREGILCQCPVTGVQYNLEDITLRADAIHRGHGQIVPTSRRSTTAGLYMARPVLLEPMSRVEIVVPSYYQAAVVSILNSRADDGSDPYTILGTSAKMSSSPHNESTLMPEFVPVCPLMVNDTAVGQRGLSQIREHLQRLPDCEADALTWQPAKTRSVSTCENLVVSPVMTMRKNSSSSSNTTISNVLISGIIPERQTFGLDEELVALFRLSSSSASTTSAAPPPPPFSSCPLPAVSHSHWAQIPGDPLPIVHHDEYQNIERSKLTDLIFRSVAPANAMVNPSRGSASSHLLQEEPLSPKERENLLKAVMSGEARALAPARIGEGGGAGQEDGRLSTDCSKSMSAAMLVYKIRTEKGMKACVSGDTIGADHLY